MVEQQKIDANEWFRSVGKRRREPADPADGNAWFRSIGRSGGLIKTEQTDEPSDPAEENE